jgi:type I restriction enzyme M protein
MQPGNIVQKIWNLCNILRGDGITYYQYISELSYILFLKFSEENGAEKLLPIGCRWDDLINHDDDGLLEFYQKMLTQLGEAAKSKTVREIYAFPTTVFSHSENLRAVINGIASIEWHEVGEDKFGDIYSGLIAKSQDARSGAGQYFTPRAVVDVIVKTTKPKSGDIIQDPAVGSGGFLVAANQVIKNAEALTGCEDNSTFYQGVEIEKNTRRICLMNTLLHDLNADIIFGDALTVDGETLESADLILANPPFGAKAGSRRSLRQDIRYSSANKQLAFLQHIYGNLNRGGRAAVVLPDNVLFEDGVGKLVRQELIECCVLHTILRLPNGIFSGAGVKTNVLFFGKPKDDSKRTQSIWFYDLRSNMPSFGKSNPLRDEHFEEFVELFGSDPIEGIGRKERNDAPRWRCMTREKLAERGDNLDWTWLRDDSGDLEDDMTDPDDLAAAIMGHLRAALDEIEALSEELEDAPEPEVTE